MTWDKKVALGISILGTIIAKWLGGWDMATQVLVMFMTMDYATGITRAYKDKVLSSAIGINGILKKVTLLFVVAVAVGIDNVTGAQGVVRLATIWFYIGMEGISILENAARIGVPIPDKIKDALLQIKDGGKKEPTIIKTVNQATTETIDGITTESVKETITATTSKEE